MCSEAEWHGGSQRDVRGSLGDGDAGFSLWRSIVPRGSRGGAS